MTIQQLKEVLLMLQELKYKFKELYVNKELLYFEDYIKTVEGMSNALYDVIQVIENCDK